MTTLQTLTRPASLSEYNERRRQVQAPIIAESTRRGLAYQPQPSDLFISPFGKCGTTWLQQIVHGLRTRGDMDFDDISRVIPWLEMAHRVGLDLYALQRGGFQAFKSHLSWLKIPKGGRYIVSFRDPKDALVSSYHFLSGWHWQAGAISITEYARHVYWAAHGDGWDGSYWVHLVSWWDQRHNPNVFLLCYEGMKADLPTTVQTIADFLGIELDQPLRGLVVNQSSLDFMLAHKPKFSDPLQQTAAAKEGLWPPGETTSKVRNGQVGAHLAELPAEISAEMDAIWRETVEARTGLSSYQALRAALA
ncbi:MAG: sulfotransferase [Chloroflexi bacterium]|nr:MAG: sulfotransferase [Chloroflexota bacterium]